MARTYIGYYFKDDGSRVEYIATIPTPSQLQSSVDLKDCNGDPVRVVISHFTNWRGSFYTAALFQKDPAASEYMRENGFDYETLARSTSIVEAKTRNDIINLVGNLLRYD